MVNTELSRRWRYGAASAAVIGLGVPIWIAFNTYTGGVYAPIRAEAVGLNGQRFVPALTSSPCCDGFGEICIELYG